MTRSTDLDLLEAIYRRNVRRVHGFARNRLDAEAAADVTSEVFHAAAIAFRDDRGDLVTDAWLMAVVRNKVNDHWRRAYRRKAKHHLTHRRRDDAVEFPVDWNDDPRRADVLRALDALPERDRSLLVLHHVDGMTTTDLAQDLAMSVAAIESALARARRRFRSVYDEEQR